MSEETNETRIARIKAMQSRIGRLVVDGFWGPKSIAACKQHLLALMPADCPWPHPDNDSMVAYYGEPGDESNLTYLTPPFPMFYENAPIHGIRVHHKCALSLMRVLTDIQARHGNDHHIMSVIQTYDGCYNFREQRGSHVMSKHAWGVAIDFDAADNDFRDNWPMKSIMPLEIMECFAREGWVSAGAFWSSDGMHNQATHP